ncbi:MAG: 2'-5' RNA ligase family protein [Nanoarchaeota archaeon]
MRCFICVEMPHEAVKEIMRIQGILKKTNFNGKLIERENLHLTLKFLGEI